MGIFQCSYISNGRFVMGSKFPPESFLELLTIVGAYLVFCVGNHQALIAGQKQLEQFAIIAKSCASKAELDVSSIKPIPYSQVQIFHLSVIAAVSFGVMAVTWF